MAQLHGDRPALQSETIYALPNALIDAIKQELPSFFSPTDEDFERDLERLSGSGFFLRRPIQHPFLPGLAFPMRGTPEPETFQQRQQQADNRIREMMTDELTKLGRSKKAIDDYFKEKRAYEHRAEDRQLGYLGWLVTNPGFRKHRDVFRATWEAKIREEGGFPEVPISLFGDAPAGTPKRERPFKSDYMQFFKHWALQLMAAWELPIPMRPEMMGPSLYHLPSVGEAGILLFVPWYLLRDKDVGLREAALHQQFLLGPPQLDEWMSGQPKQWGYERYGLMFRLYVHLELGLKQRYRQQLQRQAGKVDHALARFLKPEQESFVSAETIRKVRQEMNRRLMQT